MVNGGSWKVGYCICIIVEGVYGKVLGGGVFVIGS